VPTDSQSNAEPFAGRLYVIILDDLDVAAMRSAHVKRSAKEFVDKYMGANDIAAVIHTSGRTDASQEFTSNKQLIHAAIDKFIGRRMRSLTIERLDTYYQRLIETTNTSSSDPNSGQPESTDPGGHSRLEPTDFERGFRAVGVLDSLRNTAEFLAAVRGRRKAVLFFSEGIDYPIADAFGGHNASDVINATRDAITMAARANVNYYTIDPRGLVGMTSDGWRRLAGQFGGQLSRRNERTGDRHHGRRRPDERAERAHARADAVAGQSERACRADRRHRVCQHQLADVDLRRIIGANSRYACLAIIRRPIRATGVSTRSTCA
jgi:VWFA-related protein